MKHAIIHPTGIYFSPESRRVFVRPFISSDVARVAHIISRALTLSEAEVDELLAVLRRDFSDRHVDLETYWRRHFLMVRRHIDNPSLSASRQLYIGALFPANTHSNLLRSSIPRSSPTLTKQVWQTANSASS